MPNSIKATRHTSPITQAELANRVQLSVDSVKRYENGKRQPRAGELKKIADVLGVTTDELLKDNSECD